MGSPGFPHPHGALHTALRSFGECGWTFVHVLFVPLPPSCPQKHSKWNKTSSVRWNSWMNVSYLVFLLFIIRTESNSFLTRTKETATKQLWTLQVTFLKWLTLTNIWCQQPNLLFQLQSANVRRLSFICEVGVITTFWLEKKKQKTPKHAPSLYYFYDANFIQIWLYPVFALLSLAFRKVKLIFDGCKRRGAVCALYIQAVLNETFRACLTCSLTLGDNNVSCTADTEEIAFRQTWCCILSSNYYSFHLWWLKSNSLFPIHDPQMSMVMGY